VTLSVFEAARDAGDRCAAVVAGRMLSFSELAEGASRALSWLLERGIAAPEPGAPLRPVALSARADLPTLELLHALMALGAPVLPVHPRFTTRERELLLAQFGAGELIDGSAHDWGRGASHVEPGQVLDDERCLAVVQTSGSTGQPRGVILSRRAFAASAAASAENLGWRDDDRWLIHLPVSHVGGLSIVTRCLLARRAVVLAPPRDSFDPAELAGIILRERVTLLSLVPTQLIRLLDIEPAWHPPPALRALLLGGAAAPKDLLERAAARGVPVLTTYGLTEACSQVATQRPGTRMAPGAIGPPLSGVEVRISDGEIQLRGPTLMTAYHPDRAGSAFAGGWLATGDLGRIDADGNLHVSGRLGEIIISGGENVHPREVEIALESVAGVRSACVFGVPDAIWGELVAAAIVPARAGSCDLTAIDAHVRSRLAPFKRPRRLALLPELPLLPSGKCDRAEVARRALPLLRSMESILQNP
jgi:o-succinylbenzoate---CoA ligase